MIRPFSSLACTQATAECLAGGRSPAVWLRFVARTAEAADWLIRSHSRLGFLDQALPSLRQGPLLGSELELLTNRLHLTERKRQIYRRRRRSSTASVFGSEIPTKDVNAQRREREVYSTRRCLFADEGLRKAAHAPEGEPQLDISGRSRSTGPPLSLSATHRRANRLARVEQLRSTQRVTACMEQPPNASRELLDRLARGEHAEDYERRRAGRHRAVNISGREDTRKGPPLDVETAGSARASLVQQLVRRVAYRFGLSQPTPRSAGASGTAALVDQWSAPLGGPAAPSELLEQVHTKLLHEISASAEDEDDLVLPANETAWRAREDLRGLTPSLDWRGKPQGTIREIEGAASATPVLGTPSVASDAQRMTQRAGAASMSMTDAAEEVEVSQEDLSALSAKFKRILDEEARRHGIDV